MLQNAYFLAKIGADTAENEQHFAEILQEITVAVVPRAGAPPRVQEVLVPLISAGRRYILEAEKKTNSAMTVGPE